MKLRKEFVDEINNKVIEEWKDISYSDKMPLLYGCDHLQKGGVLFIGLNPSFNEDHLKNYFTMKSKKELEEISREHEDAFEEYPLYFKKIQEFVNDCAISNWSYIDLFFDRKNVSSSDHCYQCKSIKNNNL